MRRRVVLGGALVATAAPQPAATQAPARIPRIGFLSSGRRDDLSTRLEAFLHGLRELGYEDGRTIAIEYRFADRIPERLPALAEELVRLNVAVIVTSASPAPEAARQATRTIPIVVAVSGDPVAEGLVDSIARPGGNVTGLANVSGDVIGKQLELMKEIVPGLAVIGVLENPDNPAHAPGPRLAQEAATRLGARIRVVSARDLAGIEAAFATLRAERVDGVVVLRDLLFAGHRTEIAALAVASRMPAIYGQRLEVEAGGLAAYGANNDFLFRRSATYVDRILKGAKPADLPVELPTRFELVLNLKAAAALGLVFPPSLLLRADEVIE